MRADGFTDVVLLGMGGSSLAPEVFRRSYGDADGLRLHVLDTTEPLTIAGDERALDLGHDPRSSSPRSRAGRSRRSRCSSTSGPRSPNGDALRRDHRSRLRRSRDLAAEHGFRQHLPQRPGDRRALLRALVLRPRARRAGGRRRRGTAARLRGRPSTTARSRRDNSGLWLGVALGELALQGRDKLTFVVDPPLESFGLWVEQLIAECTGKHGRGHPPDRRRAAGGRRPLRRRPRLRPPRQRRGARRSARGRALRVRRCRPSDDHGARARRRRPRPDFFFSEFATAVAGWVLGINPFDQPNVQEAKDNTCARAARGRAGLADGDLDELLDGLAAPGYVAIMGYLPYDDAVDAAVAGLRAALLERYGVATTFGYGPRFLHSTGQFHKGGPPVGRFLQLVHDADDDLEIPGADYGFRTLIAAQADGDLQTLRGRGRPAVRVRLAAGDLAGGIDELTGRVRAV